MSEENEQNEKDKRIKIDELPVSETELTDEEEKDIKGGTYQIGQVPGGFAKVPVDPWHTQVPDSTVPGDFGQVPGAKVPGGG